MRDCPVDAIEFSFRPSTESVRVSPREIQVTRRGLLGAVGASLLVLPVLRTTAYSKSAMMTLLRPPGAAEEDAFLARCIRCGECMRACPQRALQPALLQYGLERMWTPVLTPRIGYCEFNCTLCTQVCPTGAIEPLTQPYKHQWRMGTAFFDKNRCIPWAENSNCLVCEEVCPVPQKAIHLRDEEVPDDEDNVRVVRRPYIVEANCVGCGQCENHCPVEGLSAIRVAPRYETRHGGLAVGGGFVDAGADPYGSGLLGTGEGVISEPEAGGLLGDDGATTGGADPYGGSGGSNPYGGGSDPYGGGGSDPYGSGS
jgi:MauM/NapG family ferredoxin protein